MVWFGVVWGPVYCIICIILCCFIWISILFYTVLSYFIYFSILIFYQHTYLAYRLTIGSRSVYQMNFPEASTTNYAKIENVFPNRITKFTACFWAKILKTDCAIFTYSARGYNYYDEIAAYLYADHRLDLIIKGGNSNARFVFIDPLAKYSALTP